MGAHDAGDLVMLDGHGRGPQLSRKIFYVSPGTDNQPLRPGKLTDRVASKAATSSINNAIARHCAGFPSEDHLIESHSTT